MTLPVGTLVMVVRDYLPYAEPSMVGRTGEVIMPLGMYEAMLNGFNIGTRWGYVVCLPSQADKDWLFAPWQIIPITPPGSATDEHADEGLGVGALA